MIPFSVSLALLNFIIGKEGFVGANFVLNQGVNTI